MIEKEQLEKLLARHNANEKALGDEAFGPWLGVNCEIHPNDEIFKFFYGHPTCKNPLRDYFADGWRTSYELMIVLEEVGRSLARCSSLLEFASGYGRFTRHLARFPGADKVTVSDVMPGAVEFAVEKFGVSGFSSSAEPADVNFPRQYECIFVLSLFSHLPRATWGPWLQRLYSVVEPGGCLVFTTHGDGFAKRNGVELDSEGFFFVATSESDHLKGQEYGTTITSPEFVEAMIRDLGSAEILLFRQDHFWSGQDVWLLAKPPLGESLWGRIKKQFT